MGRRSLCTGVVITSDVLATFSDHATSAKHYMINWIGEGYGAMRALRL